MIRVDLKTPVKIAVLRDVFFFKNRERVAVIRDDF